MTTTAANGSQGGTAEPPQRQQDTWLAQANLAIIITTLVAFALRMYLLVRPGLMSVTQYDDGPYFGSAVRLVHGVLPYRDFAFVQPPGITVLMSPLGLASYLFGTSWGLVIGRLVTVFAGTAGVLLAGLLVRHRGPLAVLLAGGVLAIYMPDADGSHTVLLEPWLVLFCLLGALSVFEGDRLTGSTRRLAWGGVAFGFGGATKGWAIAPVLVVALLLLMAAPLLVPGVRRYLPGARRAAVFVAGVAAGFLVPVLPFVLAAPRAFYNDVVAAQLTRVGPRTPVTHRLWSMIGIPGAKHWTSGSLVAASLAVVAFVLLVQAAAWLATRRPPPLLDWFVMLSGALIVAMFLWPSYFASHYSAFLGPFLALSLGLPVTRLLTARRPAAAAAPAQAAPAQAAPAQAAPAQGTPAGGARAWLAGAGLLLLAAAVVAGAVAQSPTGRLARARFGSVTAAARKIPPGACVLADQASFLLLADRFNSDVPGCSQMVDGLGTDLALSDGHRPGYGSGAYPAVAAAWRQAFDRASYVALSPMNAHRIAWTPALMGYFQQNFRQVQHGYGYTLYKRRASGAHRSG